MKKKEKFQEDVLLQRPDYRQEFLDLVRSNVSPKILQERILAYHKRDVASALEALTKEERQAFYQYFEPSVLSGVFDYLDDAMPYFKELSTKKQAGLLSSMDTEKAICILRKFPKEQRGPILDLIDEDAKDDIALVSSFEDDEIGSRMTTHFLMFPYDLTVRKVLYEMQEMFLDKEIMSTIFVVDEFERYLGAVKLTDLMNSRESTRIDELMLTTFPFVYGQELISDCLKQIKEYDEVLMPVLNSDKQLLGVITSPRIVRETESRLGTNYVRFAALTADEPLHKSILGKIQNRLPLLFILMALGMLVSSVIGTYEYVFFELNLVICFQSLVMGMSGNMGSQSLSVTLRSLMEDNLTGRKMWKFIGKEAVSGFLNAIVLAMVSFMAVGGYIYYFRAKTFIFAFSVSGCIAVSMLLAMLLAVFGSIFVPIIFKKAGVDPALLSSSLMTTIYDLISVIIYYSGVWLFLIQFLQLSE